MLFLCVEQMLFQSVWSSDALTATLALGHDVEPFLRLDQNKLMVEEGSCSGREASADGTDSGNGSGDYVYIECCNRELMIRDLCMQLFTSWLNILTDVRTLWIVL